MKSSYFLLPTSYIDFLPRNIAETGMTYRDWCIKLKLPEAIRRLGAPGEFMRQP
jgi:hypothetical protein